jgi:hypothetical protein
MLAEPQPGTYGQGGDEQVEEWGLPIARAQTLGLPRATYLLVRRDINQTHNHFYLAAAFPSRGQHGPLHFSPHYRQEGVPLTWARQVRKSGATATSRQ